MKTFKTVEELIEFVRDNENVATLENGEITLKDWIELGNSVEKHHKNYNIAVEEKKKSNSQKKELDQKMLS